MISCAIYSSMLRWLFPKFYNYRPLKSSEYKSLIAVSIIFIVNIVLSNTSLKYNSLALDQVIFSLFHFKIDVQMCYACLYLCSWVLDSWYETSSYGLLIFNSCYFWNYACMYGWCNRFISSFISRFMVLCLVLFFFSSVVQSLL